VTEQVATTLPTDAVTVAVPAVMPLTVPVPATVATCFWSIVHVTEFVTSTLLPSVSTAVAFSCADAPWFRMRADGLIAMEAIAAFDTDNEALADRSEDCAVMVAVPTEWEVATPDVSSDTTEASPLFQVTV